ncbi:5254_t:CDS:1 [Scutellospora calospora]|uniref:5254_t:CDS:1 n=1 Tax=Scutellospora calospora TaxID=85575 RepID=A0ACA9LE73_9GLOM|nr:5254_t:CDS:1 [Scutellospora calospora]
MNNSIYKSVRLLAEGEIRSEQHYGPYACDWWSLRLFNSEDNISNSVPYRLYMHISFILNQCQFYLKVVQNDENQLQPGFVCFSSNETSKICLTLSQSINSIYRIIFETKTTYSEPEILRLNDEKIVKKLLIGVLFRSIFLNIRNHILVVLKIED